MVMMMVAMVVVLIGKCRTGAEQYRGRDGEKQKLFHTS
jgi:hypothetical protein